MPKFEEILGQTGRSRKTLDALRALNFLEATEIQAAAIPVAMQGRDILGAARTGSGKTLAFLIPLLECLAAAGWSKADGLGALVIAPTRELASQIFAVLLRLGKQHSFSAGLVTGGKSFEQERACIAGMNILIATPGRLLQHLDQSADFQTGNLQMLVLDEADRILDLGFQPTINAILQALPATRQTLLFSATQTSSLQQLARLSLRAEPAVISVGVEAPAALQQFFVTCQLAQKLNFLWSFVKSHLRCKLLIFVSSCKQVRFLYEAFCKLQPGVPLLCLFGRQKQAKRQAVFRDFCNKQYAVLFATDIAARGLDFPFIEWVIQMDAPEDVDTYVHRIGRTARYESEGKSLLLLLPSEQQAFLAAAAARQLRIEQLEADPSQLRSIASQLAALCSANNELRLLAQKAITSYARSVYLQANKAIFSVVGLPFEELAREWGLPGAPSLKFVAKAEAKQQAVLASSDEEQIFTLKRPNHAIDEQQAATPIKSKKLAGTKKGLLRQQFTRKHHLFAEDGQKEEICFSKEQPVDAAAIRSNLAGQLTDLVQADQQDKQVAKAKRRAQKEAAKAKARAAAASQSLK